MNKSKPKNEPNREPVKELERAATEALKIWRDARRYTAVELSRALTRLEKAIEAIPK